MSDELDQAATTEQETTAEEPGVEGIAEEGFADQMVASAYPGEKTVDRVRDGIDLDDVKDLFDWGLDKVRPSRRKEPEEPTPIVIDIPMQEEEVTMRSTWVARDDPPPPPPADEKDPPANEKK